MTKFLVLLLSVLLLVSLVSCKKKEEEKKDDDEEVIYRYGYYSGGSTYPKTWNAESNVGLADYSVAEGSREKYTEIVGDGKDTVTILVYMCGSDLESKSAMGVYDLQEMAKASLSDKVNILVYTGGSTTWHIDAISNKVNQIYRVREGTLERLVDNAGNSTMVNPATLVSFIEWGVENYEADRYGLIFWDHGSGTISGYGYDEKYPKAGSMGLEKIDQALTEAGVQFDFVGFDACLMATAETGLMLAEHADYMIASEESEPGAGWYYTNWLSELSKNTSMPTLDIGINIVDDFVAYCKKYTPSQSATLSVVDLAELEHTVPEKLTGFSEKAASMLKEGQYKTIASARSGAREFASDSRIDQVDLVDMAVLMNTTESKELADALLSSIKYNSTTSDMANSYGLSIYFPYRNTRYTGTVLKTYDAIEMNSSYSNVVRNFASYQTSGQVASGGYTNPYSSLTSSSYSNSNYSSQSSTDAVLQLLNLFLGSDSSMTSNSSYSNYYSAPGFSFLFGRSVDPAQMAEYIADNHFDADLTWKDGKIHLTNKQWEMVEELELNVFVDDGTGYIDLGTDTLFEIDEKNNLLAPEEVTWLGMSTDNENWQVIPYYHVSTVGDEKDYKITGRVPCLINGEEANLIIVFSDEEENGVLVGYSYGYDLEDGVTVGKLADTFNEGDVITFVCDYYDYNGNYEASHVLGDPLTLKADDVFYIGDLNLDNKIVASYKFTDIYQQTYWTAPITK